MEQFTRSETVHDITESDPNMLFSLALMLHIKNQTQITVTHRQALNSYCYQSQRKSDAVQNRILEACVDSVIATLMSDVCIQ